jgi:hypothetical protein
VYPLLSREQQIEWEEIEQSFYHQELTKQGYEKLRHKVFARAGLLNHVGLLNRVEENKERNEKESSQDQRSTVSTAHSEFKTKDDCSKVKL